jgi:hypothetical protein
MILLNDRRPTAHPGQIFCAYIDDKKSSELVKESQKNQMPAYLLFLDFWIAQPLICCNGFRARTRAPALSQPETHRL